MTSGGCATEPLRLFARFVARHIGVHFGEDRLPDLRQKLAPLAGEAGFGDLD
jgi:hypothetical protein